jgi:NADH:ubiquinone reductase (H+-translocating)
VNLYNPEHHVVIIGAGYAGLACALRLGRRVRESGDHHVRVTLINKDPRQELTCELYRVLRNGNPAFYNFAPALKATNVSFIEGTVSQIDTAAKKLLVRGDNRGHIQYSHLVVATGSKVSDPPIEGLSELQKTKVDGDPRVFRFRNNVQAQSLRLALKRLGWDADIKHKRDLFVVVLGAGQTGIEVAGELAAMRGRNVSCRVVIVDQKNQMLEGFSPIAQRLLNRDLKQKKIESVLGSPAVKISNTELHIQNGQVIPWHCVVLCTGAVGRSTLVSCFESSISQGGLLVRDNLQIQGFADHYAIGDVAQIAERSHPLGNQSFVARRAQFATQEGHFLGDYLASKLITRLDLKVPQEFHAKDRGLFVSLGPHRGFARLGPAQKSHLKRFFSPFIAGPAIDKLKAAIDFKYKAELRLDQMKSGLSLFRRLKR